MRQLPREGFSWGPIDWVTVGIACFTCCVLASLIVPYTIPIYGTKSEVTVYGYGKIQIIECNQQMYDAIAAYEKGNGRIVVKE